jgi:hypothetical protein
MDDHIEDYTSEGFVTVVTEHRPNFLQKLRIGLRGSTLDLESTSLLFDDYKGPFLRE